jgi:hypothetical protein
MNICVENSYLFTNEDELIIMQFFCIVFNAFSFIFFMINYPKWQLRIKIPQGNNKATAEKYIFI